MRIISRGDRQSVAYGWPAGWGRQLLNRQHIHSTPFGCFASLSPHPYTHRHTHTHKVFFLSSSFFHRVDRNAIKNITVKRSWPETLCWQIRPKTRDDSPNRRKNNVLQSSVLFSDCWRGKTKQGKRFRKKGKNIRYRTGCNKTCSGQKERLEQSIYGAKGSRNSWNRVFKGGFFLRP